MASTSELRGWWIGYDCNTLKYVRVSFPGVDKNWPLYVAGPTKPIWQAVAQIMESEPYLFRESAGGTYVCRDIGSTGSRSLHAYGLALDLNPSKNPHKAPLTTDMPSSFIARMEGIRANGKQALTWGGRWSKPDAMHYQINVKPSDCRNVTWDQGDDMALSTEDKAWITAEMIRILGGGPITTPAVGTTPGKPANAGVVNSVWSAVANGRTMMTTLEATHDAAVMAAEGGEAASHFHTTGPPK